MIRPLGDPLESPATGSNHDAGQAGQGKLGPEPLRLVFISTRPSSRAKIRIHQLVMHSRSFGTSVAICRRVDATDTVDNGPSHSTHPR